MLQKKYTRCYLEILKGNILIDEYGNLLKVIKVYWDRPDTRVYYETKFIIKLKDRHNWIVSDDIKYGRIRKASKKEVDTKLKVQRILYGKKNE